MATYIKGVTDVIPKAADIKIDYDFLSKGLSALQSRYDAGYKQWKSMYNSLINSEVSSSDNETFKADYLKKADNFLSELSGIDLSNGANLQQALTLFDPLVNDTQYMRDIYLTKAQRNQFQKMNAVKYSTDPDVNAQYSPIMEQYLGIGMKRLSEMKRDDGSIEKASVNMYTPWQDPIEYASKMAKEQGVEWKTITPDGPYMVTEINGDKTVDTFRNWFSATVGNKFDNQFRIESEVLVENSIQALLAKNPNTDRNMAMQELSKTYSTEYVKTYNQDMAAMQGQIDILNAERKKLEKLYPKPDAKILAVNNQMQARKDALVEKLNNMKTSKVDDAQLAQKATQLFMSNPSSILSNQVRQEYADRFAYKQASGKVEKSYAANPVWIHQDNKRHEWAMLNARQKFEEEQAEKKFKRDLTLEQMKLQGTSTNAGIGQKRDVGVVGGVNVYRQMLADNYKMSTDAYANDKVLAVAANMTIKPGGNIEQESGLRMDVVQQAITAKMENRQLTSDQAQQLKTYMARVIPGDDINPNTITFPQIQNAITQGIRKNKNINKEFGASVYSMINDANQAREQFGRLYNAEAANILEITDPELLKYVKTDSRGNKTIDYEKINQIDDEDEREAIHESLIPNYEWYSEKSALQANTVVLNPQDASKFDYTILRSAIDNAEKIGVTDPKNSQFVEMNDTEIGTFRNKTLGGKNMAEVFDPKGTVFERKIVNGVEYIKATIPLIRSADKESQSMSDRLGYSVNRKISELNQNKLEFLIPLGKADNLGGVDPVVIDPVTGEKIVQENKLNGLIMDLAQKNLYPLSTSWVSDLANSNEIPLPMHLRSSVDGGSLSITGNNIYLSVDTPDNKSQYLNVTDKIGVTAGQLRNNPQEYDVKVRKFVENIVHDYGFNSMTYFHNQIQNNRNNAATKPDLPGWNANPWR
jgi:hypothetical protein